MKGEDSMTNTNPDLKIDISLDGTGYHNSAIIPANDLLKNNGMVILTIPFTVRANREIQFIDKQDTYIDTSWRYAALTIDSSLYIFQYGGRYDDRVALYAFSENKNRIQFTQGFAENTPKDTFVELYFDGEDYFLKCFGANEEYFPPLARLNKKTSSKEEIIMLRKDFRVKYAKKYPQKNGEYYRLITSIFMHNGITCAFSVLAYSITFLTFSS